MFLVGAGGWGILAGVVTGVGGRSVCEMAADAECIVLLVGGERVELHGRSAAMVRWLAVTSARINAQPRGALTFDFAGSSLQFELRDRGQIPIP